jgi:hypothetical protein
VTALDRRHFIRLAAGGAAAVATASALPLSGILKWIGVGELRFRAVAGLPRHPLPTYASFVVEGTVDLDRGTGSIVKKLYAGSPESMSTILFPGTARTISVTGVEESGGTIRIAGMVDGIEGLAPREKRTVAITIDRAGKTAQADFMGTPVALRLE